MDNYTILIIILLAITAIFIIKTPKEILFPKDTNKERKKHLEEKLRSYSKEDEATIVKGNKKKAFILSIPIILLLLPLVVLNIFVDFFLETPIVCNTIFDFNLGIFLLFGGYLTGSLTLFVFTLPYAIEGYTIYTKSYSPPLDAIRWHNFIAKKTKYPKTIGTIIMALPAFALLLNIYVYNSCNNLYDDKFEQKLKEKIEKKCIDRIK